MLLEKDVSYDQCVLFGKILLAFDLLHFVLQGQTCLLLQVSLDFLLLHILLILCIKWITDENRLFPDVQETLPNALW